MAALQQQAEPIVKVRRDGCIQEISARELVPGDIVLLEAGSRVPADCRLIECSSLRIQEAALTGESAPVDKVTHALPVPDLPVCDQCNMAFMGTVVVAGHGLAVVTATGMQTELGRIAALTQNIQRRPPAPRRHQSEVGRTVLAILLIIIDVLFVLGLLHAVMVLTMVAGMALPAMALSMPAPVEARPSV